MPLSCWTYPIHFSHGIPNVLWLLDIFQGCYCHRQDGGHLHFVSNLDPTERLIHICNWMSWEKWDSVALFPPKTSKEHPSRRHHGDADGSNTFYPKIGGWRSRSLPAIYIRKPAGFYWFWSMVTYLGPQNLVPSTHFGKRSFFPFKYVHFGGGNAPFSPNPPNILLRWLWN